MISKDLIYYLRKNFLPLFLLLLSVLINSASLIYYFSVFNRWTAIISFGLAFLLTGWFIYFIISKPKRQETKQPDQLPPADKNWNNRKIKLVLNCLIPALFTLLFFILIQSGSSSALASPWLVLPSSFWYLTAILIALLFLNFKLKNSSSFLFIAVWYFLFFSVSVFVYQIAFGYDQLLHQRSILDIWSQGLIEPKTIYYLGQYVLELILSHLWPWSLEWLDKLLVPFLAAILLPAAFHFNFKNRSWPEIVWPLAIFLLWPFSIFTYTVPQNLAFLFLLILLLFSFNPAFRAERRNFIILFSLALAVFFIHPLAGIPALIFVFILFLDGVKRMKCLGRLGRILTYLAQVVALPGALLLSGGRLAWPDFSQLGWALEFPNQENVFLNTIYFFANHSRWICCCMLICLAVFVFRSKRSDWKIFFFNFLALAAAYILSLSIDFPALSAIDQNSYSLRIRLTAGLFLLPLLFEFVQPILKKVRSEGRVVNVLLALFLGFFILLSLYLNYPRKDNYFSSRSFSVSQSDFQAVRFIAEKSRSDNFIVLANQQVGAAAIKEFGFKRYYGPWFYYSVQTGGRLYDCYLKMLDHPQSELMLDLLNEIGAEEAWLVVNDYWWAFDRIVEEMIVVADDYYRLADGQVYVFHFEI